MNSHIKPGDYVRFKRENYVHKPWHGFMCIAQEQISNRYDNTVWLHIQFRDVPPPDIETSDFTDEDFLEVVTEEEYRNWVIQYELTH